MKNRLKLVLIATMSLTVSVALAGGSYDSYDSYGSYHTSSSYPSHQMMSSPPSAYNNTYNNRYMQKTVPYNTVVDAALATPQLSTLVAALKAGDLVSALQGSGPFIVFAPDNAAFSMLPPGKLNDLLKPENKSQLQNILKYHVISGGDKTLQGDKLMLNINSVNNARVLRKVKTGNGYVYIINRVLMPQS